MNRRGPKAAATALALVVIAMLIPQGAAAAKGGQSHGRGGQLSALDEEWLTASMEGDLFEVKGGEIAMKNSTNGGVIELGKKLKSDHAETYADAKKLAKRLGVEVPTEPTYPQKWELSQVASVSGSQFDSAYTSLEALDHKQDIKDAKTELEDGSNKLVLAAAREDLMMYREHLALVRKTQRASESVGTTDGRSGVSRPCRSPSRSYR
jgi:putative membrane protein